MPRPKTHSRISIANAAMTIFWKHGYEATSLSNLVQQTGASRQSIYSDFGGKHDLFLAALDRYQIEVVSPAFAQVEQVGATLVEVEAYFRQQIDRADKAGLPGPGCLIANTITEVAPHDPDVRERVHAHSERLQAGFANALRNEQRTRTARRTTGPNIKLTAAMTVVFAQGLWSTSRTTSDASTLHLIVDHFLRLVQLESDG